MGGEKIAQSDRKKTNHTEREEKKDKGKIEESNSDREVKALSL